MSELIRQVGAIPFRRRDGGVEICLVQTSSGGWGIPKGHIEEGDTVEGTARKETLEEAGIEGTLVGQAIGRYEYEKRGADFEVTVFLLNVVTVRERWEDDWLRERRWVSPAEAADLLATHPVHGLLSRALSRIDSLA